MKEYFENVPSGAEGVPLVRKGTNTRLVADLGAIHLVAWGWG